MRQHFNHLLTSAIDWLFRRRSRGLVLARTGAFILALLLAGFVFSVSIPTPNGPAALTLDTNAATPALITYGAFLLAFALIGIGLALEWADHKRLARKKVIVIETRGLRANLGTPLAAAVPKSFEGARDQLLVNLLQSDGDVLNPAKALDKIVSLPSDLERRLQGLDRNDLTVVYGGLASVPFTFLTGVLLDDETPISIMDWDRNRFTWRILDAADDGKRFSRHGLDAIPDGAANVVLAVSVSYGADLPGIKTTLPGMPIVELRLGDGMPDSHWSEEKQAALARQFLECVISLSNLNVSQIHLVLAAPNSIVVRLGRSYDRRNLPSLIVYQYERGRTPPYPWGVQMPVAGHDKPSVVSVSATEN
jgi:hypothetical protein